MGETVKLTDLLNQQKQTSPVKLTDLLKSANEPVKETVEPPVAEPKPEKVVPQQPQEPSGFALDMKALKQQKPFASQAPSEEEAALKGAIQDALVKHNPKALNDLGIETNKLKDLKLKKQVGDQLVDVALNPPDINDNLLNDSGYVKGLSEQIAKKYPQYANDIAGYVQGLNEQKDNVRQSMKQIAFKPNDPNGYYDLASAKLQTGDLDEAQKGFMTSLSVAQQGLQNPNITPEKAGELSRSINKSQQGLGFVAMKQKDYPTAIQIYGDLAKTNPTPDILSNLSYSLLQTGDVEGAGTVIQQAISKDDNNASPNALRVRGLVHTAAGLTEMGLKDTKQSAINYALQQDPPHVGESEREKDLAARGAALLAFTDKAHEMIDAVAKGFVPEIAIGSALYEGALGTYDGFKNIPKSYEEGGAVSAGATTLATGVRIAMLAMTATNKGMQEFVTGMAKAEAVLPSELLAPIMQPASTAMEINENSTHLEKSVAEIGDLIGSILIFEGAKHGGKFGYKEAVALKDKINNNQPLSADEARIITDIFTHPNAETLAAIDHNIAENGKIDISQEAIDKAYNATAPKIPVEEVPKSEPVELSVEKTEPKAAEQVETKEEVKPIAESDIKVTAIGSNEGYGVKAGDADRAYKDLRSQYQGKSSKNGEPLDIVETKNNDGTKTISIIHETYDHVGRSGVSEFKVTVPDAAKVSKEEISKIVSDNLKEAISEHNNNPLDFYKKSNDVKITYDKIISEIKSNVKEQQSKNEPTTSGTDTSKGDSGTPVKEQVATEGAKVESPTQETNAAQSKVDVTTLKKNDEFFSNGEKFKFISNEPDGRVTVRTSSGSTYTTDAAKFKDASVEKQTPTQESSTRVEEGSGGVGGDVATPDGFTNRVFESNTQLGEAPNDAHISEEGYNYRVLSQNEIDAISQSGGVFAREGKQKGGNKNTKYWTKGNNKNWYGDKDNLETIRVKQDNFKENEVVRAENVEVYNKETKKFEPLIKEQSFKEQPKADKQISASVEKGGAEVKVEKKVETPVEKTVNEYSNSAGYKSKIAVGEKYYDNRYGDSYTIEKITPVEGGDVDVTLKYDKGKTRTESGNFLLYHIDAKQHSIIKSETKNTSNKQWINKTKEEYVSERVPEIIKSDYPNYYKVAENKQGKEFKNKTDKEAEIKAESEYESLRNDALKNNSLPNEYKRSHELTAKEKIAKDEKRYNDAGYPQNHNEKISRDEHRDDVINAIENKDYIKAILDGRMTAADAKAIIESAGLEVPKEILDTENATTTRSVEKGGAEVQPKNDNVVEINNPALKEIGVEIKKDTTSEGFYQVYKDGKFVGLLGATSFEQARNKGQHFDEGLMSDILTRMGIEHSKAERNIQGENEFLTIRIKNSKAVRQLLEEPQKANATTTRTVENKGVESNEAKTVGKETSTNESTTNVKQGGETGVTLKADDVKVEKSGSALSGNIKYTFKLGDTNAIVLDYGEPMGVEGMPSWAKKEHYLENIYRDTKDASTKGNGLIVLQKILQNAKKSGANIITLKISDYSDLEALKKYYKKIGFVDIGKEEPRGMYLDLRTNKPLEQIQKIIDESNSKKTTTTPTPETNVSHEAIDKAVESYYKIKDSTKASEKRALAKERQKLLDEHPEVKRIFDNWKEISKQLVEKGIIEKSAGCP